MPRDTAWMQHIPVTVTVATWVPLSPWRPGVDLGVTLRGALGLAFTAVACHRPPRDCAPCDLRACCLIPLWFEPNLLGGHDPRPYALAVRAGAEITEEEPLQLRLTWLGPVPAGEAIVEALRRMGEEGFGEQRVPHRLVGLKARGAAAVDLLEHDWPAAGTLYDLGRWPEQRPAGARVYVHGRVQTDDPRRMARPSPADLLDRMVRRAHDVARRYEVVTRRWPRASDEVGRWVELERHRAGRFGQRQGQVIDLSGWSGVLELSEEVVGFVDLLVAAEVLQVGRHTTCGLGEVEVEWVVASPR